MGLISLPRSFVRTLVVSAAFATSLLVFQNCQVAELGVLNPATTGFQPEAAPPSPAPVPVAENAQVSLSMPTAQAPVLPGSKITVQTQVSTTRDVQNLIVRVSIRDSSQQAVSAAEQTFPELLAANPLGIATEHVLNETLPAGQYSIGYEVFNFDRTTTLVSFTGLIPIQVDPPVRVSVGNPNDYVDAAGRLWKADFGFTGASVPVSTETYPVIQNTLDQELYTCFRYGTGTFSFQTGVPRPGNYKVTLKFMEHWVFGPNLRLFNVAINGLAQLTAWDLFSVAGGNYIAHDETFVVQVDQSSHFVNVEFSHGAIENPKINAIEILGAP